MTDHDPYGDPTRVDTPPVAPAHVVPATPGGPPPGGPPPPTAGPPSGRGRDPRWWILGGLVALVAVVGITLLAVGGGNDSTAADGSSTTLESTTTASSTTSSSTSTSTSTSSTTSTTSTTLAPPPTVTPGLCASGSPDDPDHSVEVMIQAYSLRDRACADKLGTKAAVDALFAIKGNGSGWQYQGCSETEDTDPYLDCAYTFTGGATHLKTSYSDTDGWVIFEVHQTTD